MKISRLLNALLLLIPAIAPTAGADEVSVAVAANFTAPMQKIAAEFEKASGNKVRASYGSTGQLYAQIRNGAPFEILLAADEEVPARLILEGSAVAGSQFNYALGKLVLWSADKDFIVSSGSVLSQGGFDRIAVVNPKTAPYGAAAVETMKALGVRDDLQAKFVMAETVVQAYQFVKSGNVKLGFLALSQILKDGQVEGSAWIVPASLYKPIRQDAVILDKGRDKPAVLAFVAFLKSDTGKALIKSYGYDH